MPSNPDFQPPAEGLKAECARMRAEPVGLKRPLVVLAGWRAPAWPAKAMARRIGELVGGPAGMADGVAFTLCFSIDAVAEWTVRFVTRRWPTYQGPVDVIGISMGGLIGRAAAVPSRGRTPLAIGRLFTLGTPHRGARLAPWIRPEPLACAMCAGSELLTRLDRHLPDAPYELICYTRLRDSWVGARNTAPPGRDPFWTPGPRFLGHQTISLDTLIRVDIARRLRAEPPLAVRASTPPTH